MDDHAAAFVARFQEVWADFDPARYVELYAPDGAILHPTGGRVERPAIEGFMAQVRQGLPADAVLEVTDWAARGRTVLLEWRMRGTAQGAAFTMIGADRFTLDDEGRALEGIAYFDPAPLLALRQGRASAPDRAPETAGKPS